MTIAAAILITAATFAAAAFPFFRHRRAPAPSSRSGSLKELHLRRDHTYALLKELESDYQSGTLSKEDYNKLEAQYKSKAVTILQEIDGLPDEKPQTKDLHDDIEKQINRIRQKKGLVATEHQDEIEKAVIALRQNKGRFCHRCGAEQTPDARFCPDCGAHLTVRRKP